jgi:hypothetical protein
MAYPAITLDVHQPPDVLVHLAPQVALDTVVLIDELTQAACVRLGEILAPPVRVYPCMFQDLIAPRAANAIDVG